MSAPVTAPKVSKKKSISVRFGPNYLGAVIDRAEVDEDRIRIFGRKDVLEQAVTSGLGRSSPVFALLCA